MVKGLYAAWTGMVNEQNRMDVMTNNLANASTVGFKKEGTTSQAFDDVLAVKLKDESVGLSNVQRIGINSPGVKIGENYTDYSQGSFRITGNTYDLALSGSGFFEIEFKNRAGQTSPMYTRAGQFTLNKEGYLVTQDGDYVMDKNTQRIKLDPLKDTAIDSTGRIAQNGQVVAQLKLVDFSDYNYLEKYGETYYRALEGVGDKVVADATVNSGCLEMSNVQTVSEMVNMISITRAYESNQKILQTIDGTLEIAANQLGRVK